MEMELRSGESKRRKMEMEIEGMEKRWRKSMKEEIKCG